MAHGVLAAAVASAGGNDALTAGVSAAASEGAAPLLANWLYGNENGSELTADQKETISSILSLTSTAVGATTGNTSDAVSAGQASENAVENNALVTKAIIPIAEVALPRVAMLLGAAAAGEVLEDQIEALKNSPEYEEMTDAMKIAAVYALAQASLDDAQSTGGKQIHEGNLEDNILTTPIVGGNLEDNILTNPIPDKERNFILTGSDGTEVEIDNTSAGGYQVADNLGLGLVYSKEFDSDDFKRSLVNLPVGERVAEIKTTVNELKTELGLTKSNQLTKLNERDVYVGEDGFLYALDTQHATFERVNAKTGKHIAEVNLDLTEQNKDKYDGSGRHDLKVK